MALTIADLQTNLNTYLGDTSTDRISAAERLQYITEATIWLQEEIKNDHQVNTYELSYIDTINYYKVTTALAELLDGADLRHRQGENYPPISRKGSRELSEEIGQARVEDSWAIERRDKDTFIVANITPDTIAETIEDWDSGVGNWAVDATNSDATNLTSDKNERRFGTASANYDVDVSQSGNNRSTIIADGTISKDLTTFEDTGTFLLEVFIPDNTETSSFTLLWGSDSSNYWSVTATTDIDGSAIGNNKWVTMAFEWVNATKTSSPDITGTDYWRIDVNYTSSQGDDTDYRYDWLRLSKSQTLTFHYLSWNVGTNSGGTDVTVFGATTDIPYFSGQYDQYKYAVSHMAASIAFDNLRLKEEAVIEENRADKALKRARDTFPSLVTPEVKSFKVLGVDFNRRGRQNRNLSNINR